MKKPPVFPSIVGLGKVYSISVIILYGIIQKQ